MLQEYSPKRYDIPKLVMEQIPKDCKHSTTIFRWWQPLQPDNDTGDREAQRPVTWLIDNVVIDQSNNPLNRIYDPLR